MYKWTKKTPGSRRRSRGSVLVIVVAVLMMIALIGTAYIATARLDRYAARDHARLTQNEATRESYVDQVAALVRRTIGEDFQNNVTGPRTVPWLANRLPQALVIGNTRVPAWRYITGHLYRSIDPASGVYVPPRYVSNENSTDGCDVRIKIIDWTAGDNFGKTLLERNPPTDRTPTYRYWAVPTSITLRYPSASDLNPYPVEKYRGKVRTFPAMQFWDPLATPPDYVRNNGKPDVYLAADADGDGIADSVLVRITPAPVEGVTYYAAVRIIDNSSAINVNTAWSRDRTYDQNGDIQRKTGTFPNEVSQAIKTFFPSNIGLRELFDGQNLADAGYHMWAINRRRFGGYLRDQPAPCELNASTVDLRVVARNVMYSDDNVLLRDDATTPAPNYVFDSLGEQMSIQLGRRLENPGNYNDPRRSPRNFQYQAFPETDAAALAYRFCMVRWEPQSVPGPNSTQLLTPVLGEFERTVDKWGRDTSSNIDALIESAPNYAQEARNRFACFPANDIEAWFQWLDYENNTDLSFTEWWTGVLRLRPLRPLLTTHNAVTSRAKRRTTTYMWDRLERPFLLYPGMLSGTVFEENLNGVQLYQGNEPFGAMVQAANQMTFMRIAATGSISPMVDDKLNPTTWDPQPYVSGKNKASINNAGFPELWRAFYQVMAQSQNPVNIPTDASWSPVEGEWNSRRGLAAGNAKLSPYCGMTFDATSPFNPLGEEDRLRMFRSPIRDPRSAGVAGSSQTDTAGYHRLWPVQVMALRSALAAVNTVGLRNQLRIDIVPRRTITLYDAPYPSYLPKYVVTVFGHRPQPFIAEVYANNDTGTYGDSKYQNPNGYVAIKLYNPYNVDIKMENWKLAARDRKSAGFGSYNALTPIKDLTANDIVPANGYLLLETTPTVKEYRPPSSKLDKQAPLSPTPTFKTLSVAELSNGTKSVFDKELIILRPVDPAVASNIEDMVPVDQFDFTGLAVPSAISTKAATWYYARETAQGTNNWDFVYPGRYNASPAPIGAVAAPTRRHQGTMVCSGETYDVGAGDPWNPPLATPPDPDFPPGSAAASAPNVKLDKTSSSATYPKTFKIQLPYTDVPSAIAKTMYPYGGFARNGDIMQVPFIGAYTIRWRGATGNKIIEMNSISMDSAFAEDTSTGNDAVEQVGRFCPIAHLKPLGSLADFAAYDWAGRLFEYLDVQVPAEEFLPNGNWWTIQSNGKHAVPSAEGTGIADAYVGANDRVGVQGRININTAPRRVLEMLPWAANANGSTDVTTSKALADRIITYRDGTNEFKTLFELLQVAGFGNIAGTIKKEQDNSVSPGDLPDGFKKEYYMMNRISNLVTTRSDTFTCYILVQGWREAGTNLPSLDWEQRKAFILDRSGGPDHLKIIPVPTD